MSDYGCVDVYQNDCFSTLAECATGQMDDLLDKCLVDWRLRGRMIVCLGDWISNKKTDRLTSKWIAVYLSGLLHVCISKMYVVYLLLFQLSAC